MSLNLMFITNNPEIAFDAQASGIDRIFVDLEQKGKLERQGYLNTVKSFHTIEDVLKVRSAIDKSELLVRVNPINKESLQEIDQIISIGTDIIMLPMFKTVQEVSTFIDFVAGRAKTCLLLETSQALVRIDDILEVMGIDEIHVGLNDLHLSMGINFMFELLSGGIVEYICKKVANKGIMYGFGGMATIGYGQLPAEMILAEHYRLGSQMVILSRQFYEKISFLDNKKRQSAMKAEVEKIRQYEKEISAYSHEDFEYNQKRVKEIVNKIVCDSLSAKMET